MSVLDCYYCQTRGVHKCPYHRHIAGYRMPNCTEHEEMLEDAPTPEQLSDPAFLRWLSER